VLKEKFSQAPDISYFVSSLSGTKTPLLKDAALRNIGYKAQPYNQGMRSCNEKS